ncbi:MAG: ATP-binding protein, partial [Bacteroidetes bacterium]|nr:ATP-binding protein [Bacteroidota bacterium]
NTPVECSLHIAPSISSKELSGEKRRSIFLAVKEALNNVLKHSQAKLVMINIDTNNGVLTIQIVDDGVGIDLDNLRKFGNGMNNMKKRIESIDGEFNIENKNGTTLTFRLQL